MEQSEHVTNQRLYQALMEIQSTISDIRVQVASLPCKHHDDTMHRHGERLIDLERKRVAALESWRQWMTGGLALLSVIVFFGLSVLTKVLGG